MTFTQDDHFIRRVSRKNHLQNGVVAAGAFSARPDETSLSFTWRNESLKPDHALDEYQIRNKLPHGDLPGLCQLTFLDLTLSIRPPLPPRIDPDPNDTHYGHLHCLTDIPGEEQREVMATLATHHGILRQFVRART